MYRQSQCNGDGSFVPTCANCVHTFRKSSGQDVVVCVPHLKSMPANNSQVCELYSRKNKH